MSETITLGFTNPDYENIHVLNRLGGTGDVFAAHKKGMDIDVVIKRTQVQYHDRIKQENESIILKSLKHQYLPRIYDVLYGQDGCIYTVMDYIKGENLEQYVLKNGPVTPKECYRWACQLCEAVQYLHQENSEKPAIIHCDIKPGNVMITRSGDICLIDFNTSLIFRRDKKAVAVTDGYAAPEQYSPVQSTPNAAMPPQREGIKDATVPMDATMPMETALQNEATVLMDEQWNPLQPTEKMPGGQESSLRGADAEGEYGAISMATDIYAIGATLYFAVTGRAPEKSLDKVTPLEQYKPKISRSMQIIITRAMQKQQEKRFQQAAEMLRALKNIDKMDRNYKDYQVRKRVIALALAVCFSASALYDKALDDYAMLAELGVDMTAENQKDSSAQDESSVGGTYVWNYADENGDVTKMQLTVQAGSRQMNAIVNYPSNLDAEAIAGIIAGYTLKKEYPEIEEAYLEFQKAAEANSRLAERIDVNHVTEAQMQEAEALAAQWEALESKYGSYFQIYENEIQKWAGVDWRPQIIETVFLSNPVSRVEKTSDTLYIYVPTGTRYTKAIMDFISYSGKSESIDATDMVMKGKKNNLSQPIYEWDMSSNMIGSFKIEYREDK